MSAWLVTDESLTITRNSIVEHLGIPTEKATKLVKSWAKLNRYALGCRYGDKHTAFKLTDTMEVRTPIQTFKSLGCLSYQCNEGIPERDMPVEWFTLKGVIHCIENRYNVSHNSTEYGKAKWE
jgi:hypothetical protein